MLLTSLVCGLLAGCVDSGAGGDNGTAVSDFDFVGLMANYADNVIVPSYERFAAESAVLADPAGPVANYCGSIGTAEETAMRDNARDAWRSSMDRWQEAEAYLVGPATDNGGAMRNQIYSFFSGAPLSTCAIDQAVVLASEPGFDLQIRSFNQRGLDGLEYLLFNENLAHSCPAQIEETQDWNSRPETERKQLRCEYASDLAEDVNAGAGALLSAWTPSGGNFRTAFIDPQNLADNLNALSDALFYIELEAKDAKLGVPTGLHADCSALTCPGALESPWSDSALANLRANLVGFRDGLTGGDGPGFDDIIAEQGFDDVNQRFLENTAAAIALIDGMSTSLGGQLDLIEQSGSDAECVNSAANPASVQTVPACALHGYLKRITDSLRTEFIVIVDVNLPDRAGGDND